MKNKKEHKKLTKDKSVSISVTSDGVHVESKGMRIKEIEALTDRVIKKHGNFIVFKNKNKTSTYYD